jgi:hypothetical protein
VEYASNVRAVVPEEEINDARSLLCHASLPSRKRMEGLEMNSNYTMDPIIKVDESLCIGCRPEQIVLSKAQ